MRVPSEKYIVLFFEAFVNIRLIPNYSIVYKIKPKVK